jgi:hypothetical protein
MADPTFEEVFVHSFVYGCIDVQVLTSMRVSARLRELRLDPHVHIEAYPVLPTIQF